MVQVIEIVDVENGQGGMAEICRRAAVRAREKQFAAGKSWIFRRGTFLYREWGDGTLTPIGRSEQFEGGVKHYWIVDGREYLHVIRYDDGQVVEFRVPRLMSH